MTEKILDYMRRCGMLPSNGNIAVGVSGGPDSVCLLFVLVQLRERLGLHLEAVHVNHGLRAEAVQDEAYVRKLCAEWRVPLTVETISVEQLAAKKGIGCEEAGRGARYEAFERCLGRMDRTEGERGCIAVAHHRDDRAETFLFHLLRGTGLDGMAGIRPVRAARTGARIIRPLLETGRDEIEAFLKEQGIGWRTDATNGQEIYTRNKIRLRLLPYAEREICAGAGEHLAREAALLERTADFVRKCTREGLERCLLRKQEGRELVLSVSGLCREEPFLREQIVRECLLRTGTGRDLTAAHVEAALHLAEPDCQSGKRLCLPACRAEAAREFDRIVFRRLADPLPRTVSLPSPSGWERFLPSGDAILSVPGLGQVSVRFLAGPGGTGGKSAESADFLKNIPRKKYTKWFDYDKITESVVFRTRRTGDYLAIDDAFSRKSLKKYMIGEKIPANERESLPLLADGQHIMWVPGYRTSTAYRVTGRTAVIMEISCREEFASAATKDTKEEKQDGGKS
ncbi:MAG: tRNA lysidine(34) synthetase TilS [Eubacteriales bacterium]|nr:tRNA lysidine(34) synthetase TilS [Eubacteriales bacterium]